LSPLKDFPLFSSSKFNGKWSNKKASPCQMIFSLSQAGSKKKCISGGTECVLFLGAHLRNIWG